MMRLRQILLRLLALLAVLAGAAPARADTPIALWKTIDGRVNFTGIQATLRTASNGSGSPCTVTAPSTIRSATLTLPANSVVVSAQLYWAGSGTPDNTVTFQGNEITATRKFTSSSVGNGFDYFGGAADVTHLVKTGGTYNFSGLTVSNGAPWCGSQGVLGGFSLLVVYRLSTEPLRVLNIYEGFQYLQNSGLVVSANNFRWNRTLQSVEEKARVGHITWEGDPTLAQNGENLTFEGKALVDANNTAGNQFNSVSNVNNDKNSHGIDFDVYDTTVVISSADEPVVTTGYSTGQDLVLLNAEILLVPTMQVSDLAIKISRAGALKINTDVEYTVTVTNNGPVTETGRITVTNTLPPGMYYVSGNVAGWSCTASSTSGTCYYDGDLAPGATAPVLTVRARVTTLGDKTNTVVVKGTTADDNMANNTASDSGAATNADGSTGTAVAAVYQFTDAKCTAGYAIGTAASNCKAYGTAVTAGATGKIFITSTANGVVATPNSGADTKPSVQFMFECIDPASGTRQAKYAEQDLPVCAPPGTLAQWSNAVTVTFTKGTSSVELPFVYRDVGKVALNLKVGATTARTEVFVSKPARIAFRRISNGTHDNPGNITSGGNGFAAAGAPLTIEVGALMGGEGGYAPNFGKERLTPIIVLDKSVAVASLVSQGSLVEDAVKRKWANGILGTQASWSEVGAVNFTVRADDPGMTSNAANRYFGEPIGGDTAAVGRFYPAFFATDVTGPFNCPKNLPQVGATRNPAEVYTCPRDIDGAINGAVYSRQPFTVTLEAYNALNARVQNYTGDWFKTVTLSAAGADGGPALAVNLTPPAGATATTMDKTSNGTTTASYRLPVGYDDTKPRAVDLTPPTTVYVRAESPETTLAGSVTISSKRSGVVSDEGSILVLNGRMKLPNALGSDLLPTPLTMRPEYWAGPSAGWLVNTRYEDTRTVAGTDLVFEDKGCRLDFVLRTNNVDVCNTTLLGLAPGRTSIVTKAGAAALWLRAPGKKAGGGTRRGGFSVRYKGPDWLPGTTGRVSYGSHRSPVIYVREMYF